MDPTTVGMITTLSIKFGAQVMAWVFTKIGLLVDSGSSLEDAARVAMGEAEDWARCKAEHDAMHG